jgi:hypothetical protein
MNEDSKFLGGDRSAIDIGWNGNGRSVRATQSSCSSLLVSIGPQG